MQPTRNAVEAKLCTEAEQGAAQDELRAIRGAMEKPAVDEASAKALRDRTVHLLGSRCFGDGSLTPNLDLDRLRAAPGAQFKAWWRSAHGDWFVSDSLTHANALHFAPSVPAVLSPETLAAGDPLRSIVCPSDAVCDPLAEGTLVDLGRETERVAGPHVSGNSRRIDAAIEACAREKPAKPDGDPLQTYLSCVSMLALPRTALPAGHYRSPRGWLVLRGRRGHYGFCDEIRAYHLATGSAYIASRCSDRDLREGGEVDHAATRQQSKLQPRTGTLSVDALRRLALLLWLKGSMVEDSQPYAEFALPEGIPMPKPGGGVMIHVGGTGPRSTHQMGASFTIADGGQVLRAGAILWSSSARAGDQLADDLVVAAETTFQPGCPPVPLPAALAHARPFGGVSALDASAESLRASAEELSKAMAGLQPGKGCRAK